MPTMTPIHNMIVQLKVLGKAAKTQEAKNLAEAAIMYAYVVLNNKHTKVFSTNSKNARDWVQNTNFDELSLPDLVPYNMLFEIYQNKFTSVAGDRDDGITLVGFAKILRDSGIHPVNNGKNVHVLGYPLRKYYSIRNHQKWHDLYMTTKKLSEAIKAQKLTC